MKMVKLLILFLHYEQQENGAGREKISYLIASSDLPLTSDLNYYDLEEEQVHFVHHIERLQSNDSLVMNTYYLPSDNSVVWAARGFVGKTDLATGTFQSLKASLYHETYLWLAVRPGGEELLFNKRASYLVGGLCRFDSVLDFILIDGDGSNPRKVLLE